MGFKEGYNQGYRTAEKIYYISNEFSDIHDPRLDARLNQVGITPNDINRLAIRPTLTPEEIGYTIGAIKFLIKNGAIWNPQKKR